MNKTVNNQPKLYIAYGSNLNRRQMRMRCSTAKPISVAVLADYRLMFRGSDGCAVATIEPAKEYAVPAVIWQIQPLDERSLDRYEGYPYLYRKEYITVPINGTEQEAMIYIMNEDGHPYGTPSKHYYDVIMEGYGDFNLNPNTLKQAAKESRTASRPPRISRKAKSQLQALQDTCDVDLMNTESLRELAKQFGYLELETYLDEHPQEYTRYILRRKD